MDSYQSKKAQSKKAKKAEPKVAKIEEKIVKLKGERKPRRKLAKPTEKKIPISLFQSVKSRLKKDFEKLPVQEQLAILQLEDIKRKRKQEAAKITAVPEELKPVQVQMAPSKELAVLLQAIARQPRPRKADLARVAELRKMIEFKPPAAQAIAPADASVQDRLQAAAEVQMMPVPKTLGDLKKDSIFKALSKEEKRAFIERVKAVPLRGLQREIYLREIYNRPPAKVRRAIKLEIQKAEQVGEPIAEAIMPAPDEEMPALAPSPPPIEEAESPAGTISPPAAFGSISPVPVSPPPVSPPPVDETGSGLKIPKALIDRVRKSYPHPVDIGVIIGLAKHKKTRNFHKKVEGRVDQIIDRFKKARIPKLFHMKRGFVDKIIKALA
jgi:hypothetical protein